MIGYERRTDGYWMLPIDEPVGLIGAPALGPYPNSLVVEAVARDWDRRVRAFRFSGLDLTHASGVERPNRTRVTGQVRDKKAARKKKKRPPHA